MCDCKSYNLDGVSPEESTDIILSLPDWVNPSREGRTVCIDRCLECVILHLWSNKVHTLNSCCGHNRLKPSIVIHEDCRNYEQIREWIAEVDDRNWDIFQWAKNQKEILELKSF